MNVLKFKSFDDTNEEASYQLTECNQKNTYCSGNDTDNSQYLQDYLKSIVGRFIKVDFLLGDSNIISKEGILKEVGTDYIVLEMIQSNDLLACDIYSIKFVQII